MKSKLFGLIAIALVSIAVFLFVACTSSELEPTPTSTAAALVSSKIYALSNSSPHVSVIDSDTNQVVQTADVANMTKWTWNDDNNYFDGTQKIKYN